MEITVAKVSSELTLPAIEKMATDANASGAPIRTTIYGMPVCSMRNFRVVGDALIADASLSEAITAGPRCSAEVYSDAPPFASSAMFSGNPTDIGRNLYFNGVTPLEAHMVSVLRNFKVVVKAEKQQDGMNRAQRRGRKGKR